MSSEAKSKPIDETLNRDSEEKLPPSQVDVEEDNDEGDEEIGEGTQTTGQC